MLSFKKFIYIYLRCKCIMLSVTRPSLPRHPIKPGLYLGGMATTCICALDLRMMYYSFSDTGILGKKKSEFSQHKSNL